MGGGIVVGLEGSSRAREERDQLLKEHASNTRRHSQLLSRHFELNRAVHCQKALVQRREAQALNFEVKLVIMKNTILARDIKILALESSQVTNCTY